MPKHNQMLAKIEAKYRIEYEIKYAQALADFHRGLQMAIQQSADAAIMAIDDVFDVNEYSAQKFNEAHAKYMNQISHMVVVEDKDDPEMAWTKDTVDKKLLQIVGADNFVPWEERYLYEE